MRERFRMTAALLCLIVAPFLLVGCAKPRPPKTLVPPRIDLARFGTLGMLEFTGPGGDGLGVLASREFLASMQRGQPGTPVVELGNQKRVLATLSRDALDVDAIRAIGEKYGVDALVVGAVQAEKVQPNLAFDSAARWMTAAAEIESGLDAKIVDTHSGATLWSTATRARAELGRVDIDGSGISSTGGDRPDDARLRLVRELVDDATDDFWPYWQ
jgi:hypothetical protein